MSGLERIVPDASVILKWVLDAEDEPYLEEANEILEGWKSRTLEVLVPSLWIYEVGNILCLKRPDDAEEILGALRDLDLPEAAASKELIVETVAISVGYRVTFYDASYLAAARLHAASMVTADVRFVGKLSEDAPVRLLGERSQGSREVADTKD